MDTVEVQIHGKTEILTRPIDNSTQTQRYTTTAALSMVIYDIRELELHTVHLALQDRR